MKSLKEKCPVGNDRALLKQKQKTNITAQQFLYCKQHGCCYQLL